MKIHLSCQRNNQASSFGHFSFKSFEQRFFFLSSLNKRNFWGNNNSNSALPVLKKIQFLLIFIFYISVTRNVNNKISFLSFTIQSFYLFKNPSSRQFFKGNSRMWTLAHFKSQKSVLINLTHWNFFCLVQRYQNPKSNFLIFQSFLHNIFFDFQNQVLF